MKDDDSENEVYQECDMKTSTIHGAKMLIKKHKARIKRNPGQYTLEKLNEGIKEAIKRMKDQDDLGNSSPQESAKETTYFPHAGNTDQESGESPQENKEKSFRNQINVVTVVPMKDPETLNGTEKDVLAKTEEENHSPM